MEIPGRRGSQAEGAGNAEAGVCQFGGSGVNWGEWEERGNGGRSCRASEITVMLQKPIRTQKYKYKDVLAALSVAAKTWR